jgi:uncharacterized spore protein YtfJ
VTDSKAPTLEETVLLIDKAREQAATMLEKIFAAAQPGAVYGQPVGAERYTVITAAEVTSGGGFGMGLGLGPPSRPGGRAAPTAEAPPEDRQSGGAGGVGGGGGSMGRPVAVIAIGPDGVTVKPVVDVTKVALAGLTAWATMLGLLRARRRARNR